MQRGMTTVDELLQLLGDWEDDRRHDAVRRLLTVPPEAIVDRLGSALSRKNDWLARANAAALLGQLGDPAAVTRLVTGVAEETVDSVKQAELLALTELWLALGDGFDQPFDTAVHGLSPTHLENLTEALTRVNHMGGPAKFKTAVRKFAKIALPQRAATSIDVRKHAEARRTVREEIRRDGLYEFHGIAYAYEKDGSLLILSSG